MGQRWISRRATTWVWVSAFAMTACSDDGSDGLAEGADDDFGTGGDSISATGLEGEGDDDDDDGDPTDATVSTSADDGNDEGGSDSAGDDGTGEVPNDDDAESTTTGDPECNDADPVTLFLSPDDSNSMSSPVQAREAVLNHWNSLSGVPIRPWEFFNYYSFDYPAADPGTVVVSTSMQGGEDAQSEYVLQIGVSSESIADDARAPMNVTLVLDTSGSMAGHSIAMLQEVSRAIAASLREGDVVSMVTWNTENNVVLSGHAVTGADDATLLAAIDDVDANGGTDLNAGLVAGYQLASAHQEQGVISRLVLISDGGANAGVTDIEVIADHAGANGEDGIYLVGVGVGSTSTYNDELMDDVTDAGKGASVFVSSEEEAWARFATDYVSTMAVAVRDVQVKLDMPPGFEIVKFSGEEFSTDPVEVEPQHLAPNDAMVFHQRIRTCAPDLVEDTSEITVTARYQDATTFEIREVAQTLTFAELLAGDQAQLVKGAAVLAYVEALEARRDASAEGDAKVATARARLDEADAALPGDLDLAEIRTVVDAL